MNILKKLFGSNEEDKTINDKDTVQQIEFAEGDIFYTYIDSEFYPQKVFYFHKLLVIDSEFNTFHVKSYEPLEKLPEVFYEESLKILVHHSPIAKNGFENPKLIAKSKISAADLIGFHEYLRQTASSDEIISTAQNYYLKGNDLADETKFEESIDEYSKAVDLIPEFYEAIENRAFSRMSLGLFNEAINDFEMSLRVFPESISGIFSIGDCNLRLGKIKEAENWFAKVLSIDPNDQLSKKFLQTIAEWRKKGLKDEDSLLMVSQLLRDLGN
jgi:tetratricopeptide (TPR) repeat protein